MADSMSSLVHQFLEHYSAPADKGRFFTQSQLFIAFRNYVARTNLLTIMDYKTFVYQLDEESLKNQLQIKTLGKIKYFKLYKPEKTASNLESSVIPASIERKSVRIPLNDLNIYLSCKLCCGYLVEATAITECLHSFCKSCIVKYLSTSPQCPICSISLSSTNPYSFLKSDVVLQDVVNKVLPGVAKNEQDRINKFSRLHPNNNFFFKSKFKALQPNSMTTIVLEWVGKNKSTLPAEDLVQKYIRFSDQTTIAHISQFALQKLNKVDKSLKPLLNCEILSGGVVLPPILTLQDVFQHGLDFVQRKGVPIFHFNFKPLF